MDGRSDTLHHPGESEIHETHLLKIYTKTYRWNHRYSAKNVQETVPSIESIDIHLLAKLKSR